MFTLIQVAIIYELVDCICTDGTDTQYTRDAITQGSVGVSE